ncbi:hypothetical protein [Chryseobacterium sp. C1]|nr:hypothetical protein [Chryseobacterium sp. C1]
MYLNQNYKLNFNIEFLIDNWQWFNLLLLLAIIGILGGLFFWLRKKKFG